MSTRPQAQRGDGSLLREDLLDAALRLIERAGVAQTLRVRDVAAEAGVTASAVYLHFGSRDELVHEVAFQHILAYGARQEMELASVASPLDRLRLRGEAYLDYARIYPVLFHTFYMGDGRQRTPDRFEGIDDIADTGVGAMARDVAEAMAQGLIPDGDAVATALNLWFGTHGLAALLLSVPGFPWPSRETLADALARFQFTALHAGA